MHVKSQITTLLVNVIGVTWREKLDQGQERGTFKMEIHTEVGQLLKHLKDGFLVSLKVVLLQFLSRLD